MHDTILNHRQELILKALKEKGALSRSNISEIVSLGKKISKITIIRDLDGLISSGFVVVSGRGRATLYSLTKQNPLLEYVDLNRYFSAERESKQEMVRFKPDIFSNLSNLYSKIEKDLWEKGATTFNTAQERLDPSIYKRELERFIIELSWKSSQIEGNTYTLIEAETLLKQNIKPQGHPDEEAKMILNHKDAFETILENKASFKKIERTDIIQLHNVLTKELVSSGLRFQEVRITGSTYEPLSNKADIENALDKLILCIDQVKFPPEKALILASMIAYIQPFADGNKRTARMISNAVLMAYNYPPLSYRNVDVNEYRSALVIFYETGSLFHFKRIFMEQLKFASENYFR